MSIERFDGRNQPQGQLEEWVLKKRFVTKKNFQSSSDHENSDTRNFKPKYWQKKKSFDSDFIRVDQAGSYGNFSVSKQRENNINSTIWVIGLLRFKRKSNLIFSVSNFFKK